MAKAALLVIDSLQTFVIEKSEHDDYDEDDWSEKCPTDDPDGGRSISDHRVDVIQKSRGAVNVTHHEALHNTNDQHRPSCHVIIQQLIQKTICRKVESILAVCRINSDSNDMYSMRE